MPYETRTRSRRLRRVGWMGRCAAVAEDNDLATLHDRNPMRECPRDGNIVSDHERGNATLALQFEQQIEDLPAYRDVGSRQRLVGDDEGGVYRQCSRDRQPLPLSTVQLVGKQFRNVSPGWSPTSPSNLTARSVRSDAGKRRSACPRSYNGYKIKASGGLACFSAFASQFNMSSSECGCWTAGMAGHLGTASQSRNK